MRNRTYVVRLAIETEKGNRSFMSMRIQSRFGVKHASRKALQFISASGTIRVTVLSVDK